MPPESHAEVGADTTSDTVPVPRRHRRFWWGCVLVLAVLAIAAWQVRRAGWFSVPDPVNPPTPPAQPAPEAVSNADPHPERAPVAHPTGQASNGDTPAGDLPVEVTVDPPSELLGSWTDEFYGQRTLRFFEDGTGKMTLVFGTAGAFLYGKQVDFDFVWTTSAKELTMKMSGGTPAKTAKTLSQLWGSEFTYHVKKVDSEELVIESRSSGSVHKLSRLAASPEAAASDKSS